MYCLCPSVCPSVRPSACLIYFLYIQYLLIFFTLLAIFCALIACYFAVSIQPYVCVCWLAFVQLSIKPIVLKHKNFCSHIRQKRYSCVVNFLNRSLMWICDSATAEEHDDDADDVDLPLVRMAFHYPGIFWCGKSC